MAMLMMMRQGNYTNKNAVENVIRYITRTGDKEEHREELVAWGGMGVGCYATPELVIRQFCRVQDCYNIEGRGGRRVFHEVLNITEEEFVWMGRSYDSVYQTAMKCAEFYYSMGFQVVFAVHHSKNRQVWNQGVHIHFVVNSVNYMTGRKWHTGIRESYTREKTFDENMWKFERRGATEVLHFVNG